MVIECCKGLQFLEPILAKFLENIREYAEEFTGDELPYFYNERATLSFLSVACGQCNVISIAEFATERNIVGGVDYRGRGDFFLYPRSEDLPAVAIEAKQNWPVIGVSDNVLQRYLDKACSVANTIDEGNWSAGLLFVTPRLTADVTPGSVTSLFTRMRDFYISQNVHAIASDILFPDIPTVYEALDGAKYNWPGIMIVVKVVASDDIFPMPASLG